MIWRKRGPGRDRVFSSRDLVNTRSRLGPRFLHSTSHVPLVQPSCTRPSLPPHLRSLPPPPYLEKTKRAGVLSLSNSPFFSTEHRGQDPPFLTGSVPRESQPLMAVPPSPTPDIVNHPTQLRERLYRSEFWTLPPLATVLTFYAFQAHFCSVYDHKISVIASSEPKVHGSTTRHVSVSKPSRSNVLRVKKSPSHVVSRHRLSRNALGSVF